MSQETEHFIKNIEIKNFKCFEDFKAEGFGRVNLIGGKNNVGKTAFMEACYLIQNAYAYPRPENKEEFYLEIIKWLLTLEENRKTVDFLIEWIKDEFELTDFSEFEIRLGKKFTLNCNDNQVCATNSENWNYGLTNLLAYRNNKHFYQIYKKNNPPQIYNTTFISPCSTTHRNLSEMIDTLKITNQYEYVNKLLKYIFKIDKIDIIKSKVMLHQNNIYKDLNDFGDGVKHFLNIILALLVNHNSVVYIDEIENGIHYTNLDKLWEIILTISKEQNVQVFATTHSNECIKALVTANTEDIVTYQAKEPILEDNEIKFIELGRVKGKLDSIILDFDELRNQVEQNQEIRGW